MMSGELRLPLAVIVAVANNGVIGIDNRLPWRLPADLKRFRALTAGHTIIMGRRTWESLPHALPNRENIVVTRSSDYRAEGARIAGSLADALASATLPPPVFCIGGGALYHDALPLADTLYITEIHHAFSGDATFPHWRREEWHEVARETHRSVDVGGLDYAFVTYRRIT